MSSCFIVEAIEYIPLSAGAIKNIDIPVPDASSFPISVLWLISRKFLNATVPYILPDSILDKNEMAVALLADSFCYATEATLASDFSLEMKIDCLKKLKNSIVNLTIVGDCTDQEEVLQLLCECRLLETLSLAGCGAGIGITRACIAIRHIFEKHPILRGKAAAVHALYDVCVGLYAIDDSNPLHLTKYKKKSDDNFTGRIVELIMKVAFSDMDILKNLLFGLTGAISTSTLDRFKNGDGERQQVLDLVEPVLTMFIDVVETNDDLKKLPFSVLAAVLKLVQVFTVPYGAIDDEEEFMAPFIEGMYSWRDEFWDKYRDRLIVPLLNAIPLLGSENANAILKGKNVELRRDVWDMNNFYAFFWTVKRHPRLWIDDFGFPVFSKKISKTPKSESTATTTTTTTYVPNQGKDATSRGWQSFPIWHNTSLLRKFSCSDKETQAYADYFASSTEKNKGIYDHLPFDNFVQMWNWLREEEDRKKKNSLNQSRVDLETIIEFRTGFVYSMHHFWQEYSYSYVKNSEVIDLECRVKEQNGTPMRFFSRTVKPTIIAHKAFFNMLLQSTMYVHCIDNIGRVVSGIHRCVNAGDEDQDEDNQTALDKALTDHFLRNVFRYNHLFGKHVCKAAVRKRGLVTLLMNEKQKDEERRRNVLLLLSKQEEEAKNDDHDENQDGESSDISWEDVNDDDDEEDDDDDDVEGEEAKFYRKVGKLILFSNEVILALFEHCRAVVEEEEGDGAWRRATQEEKTFLRRYAQIDQLF